MGWSTNPPKKTGWYLVTLQNGGVMPARRDEYPKGNFHWGAIHAPDSIIASMRFPTPYKGGPKLDRLINKTEGGT